MTDNIYNKLHDEINIRFSYIHNSKDVNPKRHSKTWTEFIDWLECLSRFPKEATKEYKLNHTPAIMPSLFDGYRRDENVIGFGSWVMIDADKHNIPLDDMIQYFQRYNLNGCIYSTTSHTNENHCLRGIIQIDREYAAESHDLIWDTIYQMFDCKLDDACNTIGRIYYIPAKWSDDYVFMKVSGEPLNIEKAKETYYKEFTRPTKRVEQDSVEYEIKHVANDEQDITDDDIEFLLKTISGRPSRKDWIRLSWAVHSYTPNAMTVLREAWPEEAKGEYDTLINKQYKGTKAPTIGSVIYEAMQCDHDIMKKLPSRLNAQAPTISRNQHWVERFSDCVVNVIDAPCGAGKTYEMLNNIVIQGGRWLYVCDTIKNIKERELEFREFCSKQNVRNFQITKAFYQDSVPVSKQVDEILDGMYSKNVVIFISNAALQILDASKFQGFSLVIDEAYEVLGMYQRKWDYNIDLADRYFEVRDTDSDYFQIVATAAGDALVDEKAFDDINATFRDLLEALSKQYSTVWCHKTAWEKRGETRLTLWTISSPAYITNFKVVWLMGDEIKQSPIYNVWDKQHNVAFKFVDLKRPRERKVPLKDRGMIYYFAEHRQASINQFKKGDSPLMAIVKWLGENHGENPFIVAQHAEDKNFSVVNITDVCKNAEILPLKTTGLNQYQHHTMCVWLGALKLSGQDQDVMKTVFDIDISTQVRWREFNPLYQFVMRTSLRDYESDTFNKVYVFDRRQAEYLNERTGMPIQHIPGVLAIDGVNKGGRPKAEHAQTPAERLREFRERKKAAAASISMTQDSNNQDATKTPIREKAEVVSVAQNELKLECKLDVTKTPIRQKAEVVIVTSEENNNKITPKSFSSYQIQVPELDSRIALIGKLKTRINRTSFINKA